ncbi:MAG: winged helix-turn-helix domain-containing protein [Alphaproteobacteria bacterium]|nr:winged helix-turn-helix domain-containing protein [Alphaproteobacteria bacterium]
MPDIVLLIPDTSLREAVAEQIKAAKLPAPQIIDALQAASWLEKDLPVIILDDQGKKTEAFIKSFSEKEEKPVLLLLSDSDDVDGVTETFPKPFRLGHLINRLKYYLETTPLLRGRVVSFGPYRLEAQNRHVFRQQNPVPLRLTEKETALLVFLAQSDQPATRQEILACVWGYDERIDTHTLETHVYQLRRKLDKEGENWIVGEQGTYRLAEVH